MPAGERPRTERRNLQLREATLVEALASTDRLGELLPLLHHHAVAAVGGERSILLQVDRHGEVLHATSAFGTERLPSVAWQVRALPASLLSPGPPIFTPDLRRLVPEVSDTLESISGVLVPLVHVGELTGLLVVSSSAPPSDEQLRAIASVGHAFVLALARSRAEAVSGLQADARELIRHFSERVSSALSLEPGLETLCAGATRLFAASRASVWLYDRRAKTVDLSASSDAVHLAQALKVEANDTLAPASQGLRKERAQMVRTGSTSVVTIPLRGHRRALGTLVLEEVRMDPGTEIEVLDRADEIGRHVSSAIENVILLEDVLRSRRELENTFNSLLDLVLVCDREGRLVQANQAFVERIGKARDKLINRPLASLLGQDVQHALAQALNRQPFSKQIDEPLLGGLYVITATPLPGGEDTETVGAVLVARDITADARFEAERAELRDRLIQSEKLAALGQLVAGIAHELNNPLQGVLGHLELLREGGQLPKPVRRDIQMVYREADRAAKIVRNLLVFAGSRRLVRKRTSVNAVLSRILALRAGALRASSIEVRRHHSEGLPRIKSDPLLIHQALLNIVLNAEQAIGPSGGVIETRTAINEKSGSPRVLIEIRDTGPGITPDALPRIFEPFYTTKDVGKGTGLGLAITYGIIQEHGGEIAFSNHPEGGAVFTVQLPVETE